MCGESKLKLLHFLRGRRNQLILFITLISIGCGKIWGNITPLSSNTSDSGPIIFVQRADNTAALCGVVISCSTSLLSPSGLADLLIIAITYDNQTIHITSITDNYLNVISGKKLIYLPLMINTSYNN